MGENHLKEMNVICILNRLPALASLSSQFQYYTEKTNICIVYRPLSLRALWHNKTTQDVGGTQEKLVKYDIQAHTNVPIYPLEHQLYKLTMTVNFRLMKSQKSQNIHPVALINGIPILQSILRL